MRLRSTNRVLLALAYLSGMLTAAAASSEEHDASAGGDVGGDVGGEVGGDVGECPSCDCTMAEFENLQKNLDSCLSSSGESMKSIQRQKDEIASLSSTIEAKSEEASKWEQERKDLHILINDLQRTIDTKTENEAEMKNVQKDFEEQIKLLENEIQAMKKLQQETALSKDNEVAAANSVANECQSNLTDMTSKHDVAIEKLHSLEEKQSNASNKHSKRLKELRNQISTMNKELERKDRSLRSVQDKYHDAREDVTNMDRELRMMHYRAQTTYFNSTLVKEDMVLCLSKTVDKAVLVAEDAMNHPQVRAAYSAAKSKLTPVMESLVQEDSSQEPLEY